MRCTLSPGGRGCRAAEGREAGEGFFVRSITPHPARNSLRSFLATLSRKGRGYESAAPAFAVAQVLPIQHDGQTKTRRLFCPTSPVLPAKIFRFPKIRNYGLTSASRAHRRARRDRHERRARDAMDAVVPQDVRRGRVRSSRVVLAPRCWC